MASGLIDVVVDAACCWSRRRWSSSSPRLCRPTTPCARGRPRSARLITVFLGLPDHPRDADPRQVAGQAGHRACARSATTPGRSPSSTRSSARWSAFVEIYLLRRARRSSPRCVNRARQAAGRPTPPARTSSASGCGCACRPRRRCRRTSPPGRPVGRHRLAARPALALAVRQFLGRAAHDRPGLARRRSASAWPTQVSPYVAPAPPAAPLRRGLPAGAVVAPAASATGPAAREAALRERLTARRSRAAIDPRRVRPGP